MKVCIWQNLCLCQPAPQRFLDCCLQRGGKTNHQDEVGAARVKKKYRPHYGSRYSNDFRSLVLN